jgi:hypothetical protein
MSHALKASSRPRCGHRSFPDVLSPEPPPSPVSRQSLPRLILVQLGVAIASRS